MSESFDFRPLLGAMEDTISDLAARWRGEDDEKAAAEIVRQYQAVLRCMILLGFHQPLDIDSELPDRLMPEEYLEILHSL